VKPAFSRIVYQEIEEEAVSTTMFQNGELDDMGTTPDQHDRLKGEKKTVATANPLEYPNLLGGYTYVGWNQLRGGKPTRFTDRRVRLAMTLLANRERVVKEIFLGYAEIAVSPFCARCKQHDANLAPHPFDVSRARDLLKEAGYLDRNNDGILDDSTGKSFEFELMFNQDREDTKRMVLLLKDLYAQAGVLLKPMPTEWAVMVERLKKQDFEAITLGWTSGIETDLYQMFHSSQTTANASNFISYKNPELDKLIEQARQTVDEPTRLRLWQAAEKILHEDQPYTFLLRSKSLLFIDKRIKNISMTSLGLNFGALPIETYVPTAQQRYKP
jgi:peptide/nickel transport system substrate-binding protein